MRRLPLRHGGAPRPRLPVLIAIAALAGACTPPPQDVAPREAVRAVVISDLNASYGSTEYPAEVRQAVRLIVEEWRPDLVLIAGDMVAGQAPQLPDSVVRAMWVAFDSVVASPLRAAGIPVVATLGNHDASAYPAHARDRRIAVEYWRRAGPPAGVEVVQAEHFPLRYAVRHGEVFVAVWDGTNQESATDAALVRWLGEALTGPAAEGARHRVVLSHLPLYGVAEGRDRPGEVLARGDELRRRLEDWGATLFVSGHHHAYYPGRRGTIELLHAGAVGDGPRPLLDGGAPPRKTVSVLDFLADSVAITTYELEDGAAPRPVPLESLPRVVCGSHGVVVRRDVLAPDTSCVGRANR